MKKMLLVMLSASSLMFQAQGNITRTPIELSEKTQTYGEKGESGKIFSLGFEIGNRGKDSIWVQVINGSDFSEVNEAKPAGKEAKRYSTVDMNIDISKPTYLAVWYQNPAAEGAKTQLPDKMFSFAPNKTLYVTWEPYNIRPTKGRFMLGSIAKGIAKTDTNLSLKKNLSEKDINVLSGQQARGVLQKLGATLK